MLKLAHWFNEVETSGFKSFSILKNTITHHYNEILNFLKREVPMHQQNLLMQKSKLQIATGGLKDKAFFLFRLSKLLPSPSHLVSEP